MKCASCGENAGFDRMIFVWWIEKIRYQAYFHRECFDSEKIFLNFWKHVLTFPE